MSYFCFKDVLEEIRGSCHLDVSTPSFLLSPVPCSLFSPQSWIMGQRLSVRVWWGQGGTSLGWSELVSSVGGGLGVRKSLVYRLCVLTFLMVSTSFRDCWKWNEMLLFCLVMEKSSPKHQGIQIEGGKKQVIYLVDSGALWVERGMASQMILTLPKWTRAWEKTVQDSVPCLGLEKHILYFFLKWQHLHPF